jgi:sugar lactone lactonase YvrE
MCGKHRTRLFQILVVVLSFAAPVTRANTFYLTDASNVYKVDAQGNKTVFASGLSHPGGVAVDAHGNVYAGDSASTAVIFKYTPDGTSTVFASGLSGDARSMAFDAFGNLFVGTEANGVIYKFDPAGNRTTFAIVAQDPSIIALAFAPDGNLFAAFGQTVYRFGTGTGHDGMFATVRSPAGLAFDRAGNLFVSDNFDGTIMKFDPAGNGTTFADSGLSILTDCLSPTANSTLRMSDCIMFCDTIRQE